MPKRFEYSTNYAFHPEVGYLAPSPLFFSRLRRGLLMLACGALLGSVAYSARHDSGTLMSPVTEALATPARMELAGGANVKSSEPEWPRLSERRRQKIAQARLRKRERAAQNAADRGAFAFVTPHSTAHRNWTW